MGSFKTFGQAVLIVSIPVTFFIMGMNFQRSQDNEAIRDSTRRMKVSEFNSCLHYGDSRFVRDLYLEENEDLKLLPGHIDNCAAFLDDYGSTVEDDEIAMTLGELRLYLSGYREEAVDLIRLQEESYKLARKYVSEGGGPVPPSLVLKQLQMLNKMEETEKFLQQMLALSMVVW